MNLNEQQLYRFDFFVENLRSKRRLSSPNCWIICTGLISRASALISDQQNATTDKCSIITQKLLKTTKARCRAQVSNWLSEHRWLYSGPRDWPPTVDMPALSTASRSPLPRLPSNFCLLRIWQFRISSLPYLKPLNWVDTQFDNDSEAKEARSSAGPESLTQSDALCQRQSCLRACHSTRSAKF